MSSEKRPDDPKQIREMVSEGYARVAREASSCCGGRPPGADEAARKIGYEEEQLEAVPDGANLGVGCGNPTAIDALRPGEVVVDLGSGAGMDSFLAARQVGETGRVIGIDMTDDMLEKARENARKGGFDNVEFRKGIIEELPVEDESVDVILSNCVINLSPEKHRVFAEAYRVLKPGGRMMVSDVVLEQALPEKVLRSVDAYIGCVGGASLREEYLETIRQAGFSEVRVEREACFGDAIDLDDPQIDGGHEGARDHPRAGARLREGGDEPPRLRPQVSQASSEVEDFRGSDALRSLLVAGTALEQLEHARVHRRRHFVRSCECEDAPVVAIRFEWAAVAQRRPHLVVEGKTLHRSRWDPGRVQERLSHHSWSACSLVSTYFADRWRTAKRSSRPLTTGMALAAVSRRPSRVRRGSPLSSTSDQVCWKRKSPIAIVERKRCSGTTSTVRS